MNTDETSHIPHEIGEMSIGALFSHWRYAFHFFYVQRYCSAVISCTDEPDAGCHYYKPPCQQLYLEAHENFLRKLQAMVGYGGCFRHGEWWLRMMYTFKGF